jgi:hypothetical protein
MKKRVDCCGDTCTKNSSSAQQQQQQQQRRILHVASTILDEAFKKQHELRSFGRMLSGTC